MSLTRSNYKLVASSLRKTITLARQTSANSLLYFQQHQVRHNSTIETDNLSVRLGTTVSNRYSGTRDINKHRHTNNEFSGTAGEVEEVDQSKCSSCGIELQLEDPDRDGYYKPRNENTRVSTDDTTKKSSSLSEMEKLLLKENGFSLDSIDNEHIIIASSKKVLKDSKNIDDRLKCERCVKALYHNDDSKGFNNVLFKDIMEKIPKNANIVYVVSALDFPLSLNRDIIKHFNSKKIFYVITKIDAFFDDKQSINRTGLRFFQDSLEKLVDCDPSKVFLASGKLGWNTESLLSSINNSKLYFVGSVNSGKSTIIKTLIYRDDKNLKSTDNYGPGISHLPNFTRDFIKFRLPNSKRMLIDTPGFINNNENDESFKYILPDLKNQFCKILNYTSSNIKSRQTKRLDINSKQIFDGDKVFSLGGLFYLKPPKDAIFQIFKNLEGKEFVCKSIERAKELNYNRNEALNYRFSVKKEIFDDMVRYVIPPFYGNIDIVFKNLGYITIKPIGKRNPNEFYQIYVPKGISVLIRENIFSFIYKTKSFRDETGNKLLKENVVKRGTTRLRKVPKNKLIFSKLLEVPYDISNKDAFNLMKPESLYDVDDNSFTNQEEFPNLLWRDPDLN
ncbi:hypothetical protein BVG19_g3947 [[Candida] boidinii]|nr:hypothetical protein BVG19_g3947 [[Candida] boidinii]OWB51562.1 hypothetical protein B5S27_g3126 [[Candida] boidinii]